MKFSVFFLVFITYLSSFELYGQNTHDKLLQNASIKRVSSNIDTTDNYFIEAKELHDKARDLLHGSQYLESFTLFYKTKILLEDRQMTNSYLYPWCLGKLGFIYFIYGDYEKSYNYLFNWLIHPYSYDERLCNMINTLALSLGELGNHNLAVKTYHLCLEYAKKYDQEWVAIILGNLSNHYRKSNESDREEQILLQSYRHAIKYNVFNYTVGSALALARIKIEQHKINEAEAYLDLAYCYADTFKTKTKIDLSEHPDFNNIKADYYKAIDRYDLAIKEQEELLRKKSIWDSTWSRADFIRNENAAKSEIIKNELEQSRKKVDKLYWVEILTVLISSFLLIFFSRKVYKQRKIIEKQQLKFETRTQLVENELEKNQLELLNLNLASKKSEDQVQVIDLSTFTNLRFIHDDDWESFKLLFANVYPEYLNNLLQLCPDLTVSDQRMACLHRLNLKNEQMAEMLGISKDSLRKTNQRLREKLNIKEQAAMIDYLFTIPT